MTHNHPRLRKTPAYGEVLDALKRLHDAVALGHFRRADGSLGRIEFETAMREARLILQASNRYGRTPLVGDDAMLARNEEGA